MMESLIEFDIPVAEPTLSLFDQVQKGLLSIDSLPQTENLEKQKEILSFLEKENPIFDDPDIFLFEETHKYYVYKVADHISVSGLGGRYWPEFPEEIVIARMQKSKNYNESHRHWGKSAQEIKLEWKFGKDEASRLGKAMHLQLEIFYNQFAKNNHVTTESLFEGLPDEPEFRQFRRFHQEVIDPLAKKGLKVFRTEKRMFLYEYKLAGTFDILFQAPDTKDGEKSYYLMDWKRCKEIKFKNDYKEKGLSPLQDLDNCNFNHYMINLSFYRYMLKVKYNINVKSSHLIIFHPNQNRNYQMLRVDYREDLVLKILELRKKELEAMSLNPPVTEDSSKEIDESSEPVSKKRKKIDVEPSPTLKKSKE